MSARPPVTNLDGLSDVVLTAPADDQTLVFDSGTSKWNNATSPSGSLATLTDTTIATPVDDQLLKYDSASGKWINYGPLAFTDVTGNINVTQVNNGTDADATTYHRGDGVWAAPAMAGTIPATTSVLIGDNAGNAAVSSPAWAAGTTGLSATGANNGDFGLDVTNSNAGATATASIYLRNATSFGFVKVLGASYTPSGIATPDDLAIYNGNDIAISTTGAVTKFSNNSFTNERVRIGNGLSVGTTTDSGVGIINVLTGFRINNAAPANTTVKGNGTNYVGVSDVTWDGLVKVSGADFTTTNTTQTDITGLASGNLTTSTLYEFELVLLCNSSDANGLSISVTSITTGATVFYNGTATSNAANVAIAIGQNTLSSATGTFLAAAADGVACVKGFYRNGSTTGGFKARVAKTTAGTAKIYIGSCLKWRVA